MTMPNKSVFKNRKKEATFWEENYKETWNKGKPISVKFSKNLSTTINIRLDPKTLDSVRDKAHKRGLGPTQLIRMWIMEKVGRQNFRTAEV